MEWSDVETIKRKIPGGFDVEIRRSSRDLVLYRIFALPGKDAIGEDRMGFTLDVGPDSKQLAHTIARALAGGELSLFSVGPALREGTGGPSAPAGPTTPRCR